MTTIFDAIPEASQAYVKGLLTPLPIAVKITRKRLSKHGDYRKRMDGKHEITLNETENPYRFLITLIHEIAHYIAFEAHGFQIKPHGREWKQVYKDLMMPLLHPEVFPDALLPFLAKHFKNPKAATDTDFHLVRALNRFDLNPDKTYIFELNLGEAFVLPNERKFIRGQQRRKRFECVEISTQKKYLVSPHAAVQRLDRNGEKTMEN
jgi:SprT protein